MTRSHRSVFESLRKATQEQYPVEIDRGEEHWANWVNGYVVCVREHWVLLQSLAENVYVDGYTVLRVADITGIRVDREGGYIERAVAGLGGRPEVDFHLPDQAETKDVLRAAADHSSLISVYFEAEEDSPRLVGHLGRLGAKKCEMQLINPRGVWTAGTSR
ncbi:MAG: hypothetical protein QM619_16400 [Micropruina sp.]